MKVKIKDKLSGRIRELNKRDADIMVKLKRAEYYQDGAVGQGTYQTKVMTATPPGWVTPPSPPLTEAKKPLEPDGKNVDTGAGDSATPPKKNKTKKKKRELSAEK